MQGTENIAKFLLLKECSIYFIWNKCRERWGTV